MYATESENISGSCSSVSVTAITGSSLLYLSRNTADRLVYQHRMPLNERLWLPAVKISQQMG